MAVQQGPRLKSKELNNAILSNFFDMLLSNGGHSESRANENQMGTDKELNTDFGCYQSIQWALLTEISPIDMGK